MRVDCDVRTGRSARRVKPASNLAGRASSVEIDWVSRWKGYRDVFLIFVGFAYVMGYMVWSLAAMKEHLGPLPVLQVQYLVAGLLPASCIVVSILMPKLATRIRAWVDPLIDGTDPRRHSRGIARLMGLSLVLVVIVAVVSRLKGWLEFGAHASDVTLFSSFVVLAVLYAVMLPAAVATATIMNITAKRTRHWVKWPLKGASYILPNPNYDLASILIPVAILWSTSIYVVLPQEIGGIAPRPARLDLVMGRMSLNTMTALGEHSESTRSTSRSSRPSGVFRSGPVEVLFDAGSYLLVRVPSPRNDGQVYSLPRDVVESVIWDNPPPKMTRRSKE